MTKGKKDVHLVISEQAFNVLEDCRKRLGLNRSALVELIIDGLDEDSLSIDGLELVNAGIKMPTK